MLGAIYMATDYVTSPMTPLGQIIYGIGIEDLVAALWKLRDEVQVHEPLHHFVEAENVDEEEFEDIEVIYTRE